MADPTITDRQRTLAVLLDSGSTDGREDLRKFFKSKARQMAAAPELVNALGTLLMRLDAGGKPFPEDWERARKALALTK